MLVYLSSVRMPLSYDSVPARMLPFSILRQHNLDLDEFAWLRRLNPEPYFLRRVAGHWLSNYPVAVPVLVSPLYLPVVWWLERQHIDDEDVRFRLAAVGMERLVAALIAAASVSLVFLAATALVSVPVAVAAAVVYALGTTTWAISSQALWQHGPAELALAGLCLSLLAPGRPRHAVLAGVFAALGVLARPTMLIFALAATLFVWRERRSQLVWFLSLPMIGAAALLLYTLRYLHLVTAGSYGYFTAPSLDALWGLLFSPNRGLFIYTPVAALALPLLLAPRRVRGTWLSYAGLGVAGYLVLYSAWYGWRGGQCYGPRFLTDMLPVLALYAAPTAERLWREQRYRVLIIALAAYSVVVQGIGVFCDDNDWNITPAPIEQVPQRVWDWRDPQILRAARAGWHGFDLVPVLWHSLADPEPARLRLMTQGELTGEVATADPLPLRCRPGGPATVHLRVTNLSPVAWPAFSEYGNLYVWMVYRWWHDGAMVSGEGGFIHLPWNLDTQHSVDLQVQVDVPSRPGAYQVEFRVAQALDSEKGAAGNALLRLPVEIQ